MKDNVLGNIQNGSSRLNQNGTSLNCNISKNQNTHTENPFGDLHGASIPSPQPTTSNEKGLPNKLKEGIEDISGYSMDDVRVHYNSAKPAQLQAHAYAQGTDIHLASGQEKHLPHEAWHVVQQKQGRVKPTIQLNELMPINNDQELEQEADLMGTNAIEKGSRKNTASPVSLKKKILPSSQGEVIQGVFLAINGGVGQDFKQQHAESIIEINQTITGLLNNHAQRKMWLEGFPDPLKLNWVSYLLNQKKDQQHLAIAKLCNGLITFPFDNTQPPPYSQDTLRMLMGMKTSLSQRLETQTDVRSIDVTKDTYELVTVDINGQELRKEQMINPVFRTLTNEQFSFIKVELPENTTADTFKKIVTFKGKHYRIDMLAGSSLKSSVDNAGSVYGVEVGSIDLLKNMLGFEESSYYAQRALFPLVVGGVEGQVRGRTLPVGDDNEKTFYLKNGTPIQVEDGWGYIVKSLADKMQEGGLSHDKRTPTQESGRTSYQMLEWLDTEDPEIVYELVNNGLQAYQQFLQDNPALTYSNILTENTPNVVTQDIDKIKTLHSIFTTGKPPMESAVAMPVSGDNVVVPQTSRFTGKTSGQGASIIRSPADKQNFHPIPAENIDQDSGQSRFVSDIEGIQYTLTGKDNGVLTFFKGMLGIIPDDQWPDAWKEVDLIVTSKDRKLYEDWVKDSSLQGSEDTDSPQNDRATAHKTSQDFLIRGSLVATQWFDKGSFVGVPNTIQKWLGGDYDGDEMGMIFNSQNPQLNQFIANDAFEQNEVNPKLKKTFTLNPNLSREKRFMDMRSANVGLWSSLAAQVKALPDEQNEAMAEATSEDRLLPDDSALNNLSEPVRMIKEIQLGMKVGTDAYKTAVSATDFEDRAKKYQSLLKIYSRPITHDKKLQKLITDVGIFPTLKIPAWRNIFFSYDTVNKDTGEYQIKGLSPRVLQRMVRNLLPPEDLYHLEYYYNLWKQSEGFDPTNKLVRSKDYICQQIDAYNHETKEGATENYIWRAFGSDHISNYDDFERAFINSATWYWQRFNQWAYQKYLANDNEWKAALRTLLKRYFMLSI
ncbi:DUF4157 domain-containing protein [Fulvivirga sp. 29W222]|uniref:DUF4157 domain-containing protein n=1 Tax=Fulvivirga marina TaxID=2494733 RepID=A0A937FU57_9BACT|nr:DUF4157 domain-containing protein [Fulvivirga marina]MBL6446009.1 DUF4157 domain-containing protein [Fulvivirga marina]